MRYPILPASAAVIAAAIMLSLPAAPARADDAETITACLKAEHKSGHDGRICIGRIADPCLEKPDSQSTMGMVACADREMKIWDALLNAEYKRLLGMLGEKAAASVKASERAWIALRDADCAVPYDIFEGGTMAQPIAANCVLNQTASRAIQLRNWRKMVQPEEQ